ncbi:tetratricopeptide repeat protein [Streptomyces sp. NPDC000987]|uniref:tetratricopeptide repeat protein n=1 Tax=Streptomyces sp. NPDC000987 TaxID=3154374 RepID=UPI00332B9B2F
MLDLLAEVEQHHRSGQWAQARAKAGQAVRLAGRLPDSARGRQLALTTWRTGAELLRVLGRYRAAERVLRQLVRHARTGSAEGDLELALTFNGLGILYRYTGRGTEAEQCYTRALSLFQNVEDVVGEATVQHNLAGLYFAAGQLDAAEQAVRRALDIRHAHTPEAAAEIAADSLCLAGVLAQAERLEAKTYAERALRFYRETYGPDHVEVGYCLQVLGHVAATVEGDRERARGLYEHALRIKKQTLGPEHPELLSTLLSLIDLSSGPARDEWVAEARLVAAPLPDTHPLKQQCGPVVPDEGV